ncbi:restriction endonuclease subunit S [Burkholderia stagnalis]|uniref:restriction endonuclease subunit S n=1 Tax=Burkholderia stagnalis TaxID=1503054 RepID=UPI000F599954|nr:restriction endonuclease subunit S [Burkholderia stagnalis]RQQ36273.1 restriction endonuclease subunit S [Burkholderia stagnalis]RQY48132.1 restriction endonuclease subunit S [Burkholderia stagnalis]
MRSETKTYTLEECLDALIDYRGKTPRKTEAGIPLITAKVVKGGRIEQPTEFIEPEDFGMWMTRGLPEVGDVVMTTEAPLGEVGQIHQLPVALAQRIVTLRGKKGLLDNDYLLYLMQTDAIQAQLRGRASGTTVVGIKQSELRKIALDLPPLCQQIAAASVLRALDDRIDLLRQSNTTLESITHALFKSWFIDFDPVRTKAEGREPEGMDAVTAALFPDAFEDSTLGEIPKGWAVRTLAEHTATERGLSYKGAGLCAAGEGVPMHNLNSVLEGGDYKYSGIKHYCGDYKERHIAVSGDIIVANTEQGHNHRLIGFPAIVPARYGKAIFSHHIYRVRIKPDSPLTTHTLYYMLMAPSVREQVIGCANGSTVNMLKVAGLEIPQFVCPSAETARAFESRAAIFRAQLETNVERAETLAGLRETLLPRLISGKLPLREAEAQLNEALA